MNRTYLWSLPIGLAWPIAKSLIFFYRFEELPVQLLQSSLIFLPMGLVSALVLLFLVRRAENISRKAGTIFGYLLASPFALIASMFSGLLLSPLIGPLIYGAIPLLLGSLVGYIIGGFMGSQKAV
jgi:hypothetical protein